MSSGAKAGVEVQGDTSTRFVQEAGAEAGASLSEDEDKDAKDDSFSDVYTEDESSLSFDLRIELNFQA